MRTDAAQGHPLPRQFADRRTAGAALAGALDAYVGRSDVVVLALPRGGVPVAYEVASRLGAPLDVLTVRKLGVPGHEEIAMGAIASGGIAVFDNAMIADFGLTLEQIARVLARERTELARREAAFRRPGALPALADKVVILIDDGLATGSTMRAAVGALRSREPKAIVVAVPIASAQACRDLAGQVDHIVCLVRPDPFRAVGQWYGDFSETSDDEVRHYLARAAREHAERPAAPVH